MNWSSTLLELELMLKTNQQHQDITLDSLESAEDGLDIDMLGLNMTEEGVSRLIQQLDSLQQQVDSW